MNVLFVCFLQDTHINKGVFASRKQCQLHYNEHQTFHHNQTQMNLYFDPTRPRASHHKRTIETFEQQWQQQQQQQQYQHPGQYSSVSTIQQDYQILQQVQLHGSGLVCHSLALPPLTVKFRTSPFSKYKSYIVRDAPETVEVTSKRSVEVERSRQVIMK